MSNKLITLEGLEIYNTELNEKLTEKFNKKQETLISGENIATINGQSLLGAGNIEIETSQEVEVDNELNSESTNPVQNKVIASELDKKQALITRNNNRINAIENAFIAEGFITKLDSTMTTERRQTGGEVGTILDGSYATINKISGNSVVTPKTNNLIDIDEMLNECLVKNEDGSYNIKYTDTNMFSKAFNPNLSNGTYTFSAKNVSFDGYLRFWINGNTVFAIQLKVGKVGTYTFKGAIKSIQIYIDGSSPAFKNLMLNPGDTALPYEEYGGKLTYSKISGIKSIGRNLVKTTDLIPATTSRGLTFTHNIDGSVNMSGTPAVTGNLAIAKISKKFLKGTYSLSVSYDNLTGTPPTFSLQFLDYVGNAQATSVADGGSVTLEEDYSSLVLYMNGVVSGNVVLNNIKVMLNNGDTVLPYVDYKEEVLDFGETIELKIGDTIENNLIVRATAQKTLELGNASFVKCSDEWQREGWFSAYAILLGADEKAVKTSERKYISNAFAQGDWAWNGNTFTSEEKYFCVQDQIFYCIIPNATIGVAQEDTDEVKLSALKTWLTANIPTIIYKTQNVTTEPFDKKLEYIVWDKGMEQVLTPVDGGGKTCFDYGCGTTEDNTYFVVVGGNE